MFIKFISNFLVFDVQIKNTQPPLVAPMSKNAVSVINEYAQANKLPIDFNCTIHGPDHRRRWDLLDSSV